MKQPDVARFLCKSRRQAICPLHITIPFKNCAAIFPNQQAKRAPKKFNPMLMPPIRDLVAAHDMI